MVLAGELNTTGVEVAVNELGAQLRRPWMFHLGCEAIRDTVPCQDGAASGASASGRKGARRAVLRDLAGMGAARLTRGVVPSTQAMAVTGS